MRIRTVPVAVPLVISLFVVYLAILTLTTVLEGVLVKIKHQTEDVLILHNLSVLVPLTTSLSVLTVLGNTEMTVRLSVKDLVFMSMENVLTQSLSLNQNQNSVQV